MINFFRKIRKQLADQNKPLKYFRYAIGEILLVVIGILIALQVDNWNTVKQEERELEGYLSNIAKNVTADLEQLNELRAYRSRAREGSGKYMALVEKDPIPAGEILEFFEQYGEYLAIFEVYFLPDISGFEALKSSGYLSKLQGSEIETELYHYYGKITQIARQETSVNTFIEEMETDLFRDNVMQRLLPLLKTELDDPRDLSLVRGFLKHPSSTGANLRNSHLNTLFEDYENLEASGRRLLELIQKK
jgi:hypothetical protein